MRESSDDVPEQSRMCEARPRNFSTSAKSRISNTAEPSSKPLQIPPAQMSVALAPLSDPIYLWSMYGVRKTMGPDFTAVRLLREHGPQTVKFVMF